MIEAWKKDPQDWESAAHQELQCTVTVDTMSDPVLTCDGHSYEREAILEWLKRHSTSPKSNVDLAGRALIENRNLRLLGQRLGAPP